MKQRITIRELAIIGVFTALTAVLSQISVPLPFTPIPISFGLVAVYITGLLLKPKHAILTQVCYLLLGAFGIPVYSGFKGGLSALFGSTGGYLMVYPIMAGLVALTLNSRKSRLMEHGQKKVWIFVKSGVSICLAHVILYVGGTLWLCAITKLSFTAALTLAVYPYILLDALKIVFCIAAIVPLRFRFLKIKLLMLDYKDLEAHKGPAS